MPLLWEFSQVIDYNWHQLASVLFRKYPNDSSPHVVSVDTLERTVDPETGIVRTERIIGVQQPAPKWVTTLLGTTDASYAREVAFVVPSTTDAEATATSPPQILVSSINMSLKNVLTCYERISYTASRLQPAHKTEMKTLAAIEAQGTLRTGFAAKRIGQKFEEYSMDRYMGNSQIGRRGLDSVLEKYFPHHDTQVPLLERPEDE